MTIKVGIIGCGKIAQVRHIPEYAENPDVKLAAFFSPNRARAQEQADKSQRGNLWVLRHQPGPGGGAGAEVRRQGVSYL